MGVEEVVWHGVPPVPSVRESDLRIPCSKSVHLICILRFGTLQYFICTGTGTCSKKLLKHVEFFILVDKIILLY